MSEVKFPSLREDRAPQHVWTALLGKQVMFQVRTLQTHVECVPVANFHLEARTTVKNAHVDFIRQTMIVWLAWAAG